MSTPSTSDAPRPISEKQQRANEVNAMLAKGPVTADGRERSSQNAVKHYLSNDGPALDRKYPERIELTYQEFAADLQPADSIERAFVRNLARSSVRLDLFDEAYYSSTVADKATLMIHWENQNEAMLLPLLAAFDNNALVPPHIYQQLTSTFHGARLIRQKMDRCMLDVFENRVYDGVMRTRIRNAFGLCESTDLDDLFKARPKLVPAFRLPVDPNTGLPPSSKLNTPVRLPTEVANELTRFMLERHRALKAREPELSAQLQIARQHFEKKLEVEQDPVKSALWNRYLTAAERGFFRNLKLLTDYRRHKREEAEARAAASVERESRQEARLGAEPASASKRKPKLSRDQQRVLKRERARQRRAETSPKISPAESMNRLLEEERKIEKLDAQVETLLPRPTVRQVPPRSPEQVSITSPPPASDATSESEAGGLNEFLTEKPTETPAEATNTTPAAAVEPRTVGEERLAHAGGAQACAERGIGESPPPHPRGSASR